MTYNGWENRATWLVSVWVGEHDMERAIHRHLADMNHSIQIRADSLREYITDEFIPTDIQAASSFLADIVSGEMDDINCVALVEAFEAEVELAADLDESTLGG